MAKNVVIFRETKKEYDTLNGCIFLHIIMLLPPCNIYIYIQCGKPAIVTPIEAGGHLVQLSWGF